MTRMVGLGLKGTDEELNAALEYLATHFKGEAAAPLNLNRATPVQLQSIVGLLRSESAALIAHRAKTPCKTLDDLKSVQGRRLRQDREAPRPAGLLLRVRPHPTKTLSGARPARPTVGIRAALPSDARACTDPTVSASRRSSATPR